jgi:hypothetical protein
MHQKFLDGYQMWNWCIVDYKYRQSRVFCSCVLLTGNGALCSSRSFPPILDYDDLTVFQGPVTSFVFLQTRALFFFSRILVLWNTNQTLDLSIEIVLYAMGQLFWVSLITVVVISCGCLNANDPVPVASAKLNPEFHHLSVGAAN